MGAEPSGEPLAKVDQQCGEVRGLPRITQRRRIRLHKGSEGIVAGVCLGWTKQHLEAGLERVCLLKDDVHGLQRLAHTGDAGLAEQGLERFEMLMDQARGKTSALGQDARADRVPAKLRDALDTAAPIRRGRTSRPRSAAVLGWS